MTRKILTIAFSAAIIVGCQESLEERAAREAREYTEKHCPAPIAYQVTMDSMTFDRTTLTIGYHYALSGQLDDSAYIRRNDPSALLLQQVKNSTNLKIYKEAGYNLRYVYRSSKTKATLMDVTFKPQDYE